MMMKSAIAALIATYVSAVNLDAEALARAESEADIAVMENDCNNRWYWDSCMWAHCRVPCPSENVECGMIYWDAWQYYEWTFTCEAREAWAWC